MKSKLKIPSGEIYLMTEIVRERERSLHELLSAVGLTLHEWRVLRIIYSHDGDVPMSTLVSHSQTDRTALGRSVDRLVARNWVTRTRDPNDGRAVFITRTAAADETFNKALKIVKELDEKITSNLSEIDMRDLNSILRKISSHIKNSV